MRRLPCFATAERELGRYDLRRKIAHGDLAHNRISHLGLEMRQRSTRSPAGRG